MKVNAPLPFSIGGVSFVRSLACLLVCHQLQMCVAFVCVSMCIKRHCLSMCIKFICASNSTGSIYVRIYQWIATECGISEWDMGNSFFSQIKFMCLPTLHYIPLHYYLCSSFEDVVVGVVVVVVVLALSLLLDTTHNARSLAHTLAQIYNKHSD